MEQLKDSYGRIHDYLRISVTDRCNLRCIYCMGPEGVPHVPHKDILSYEEILQVVKYGAEMGISKIRITGGEPLVRKDLTYLIKEIAQTPGINDLSLTTNGILLPRLAEELKTAGLHRVNISLDTLEPEAYRKITRDGELKDVLEGIEAARAHGLKPVKINTVLMKNFNDREVLNFLEFSRRHHVQVRFIEYMPIGEHDNEYENNYLSLEFVKKTAHEAGFKLIPIDNPKGAGPAKYFSFANNEGTVGLITSISGHFCDKCNRLRLTSDGRLKTCLYWQEEEQVRPVLDNPAALKSLLREIIRRKPKEHLMGEKSQPGAVEHCSMRNMSRTGG